MLSGGDQLFIGFEKVSATAHCRQVRQLLEKLSSCLGRSTTKDKARTLPKLESTSIQSQHWDFFCDESAEFIDFDEGAGFSLC
jgi:hypothetical protein